MKPFPLLALVCIITGFASQTQAMTERECIRIAEVSTHCHWSKATGGRRDGWFDMKVRKEVMPPGPKVRTTKSPDSRPRAAALPPGAAMTTRNDHDLDHGLAASGSGDRSHSGNPDLSDRKIVPVTAPRFEIEDWDSVFAQRERTVLRDGLLTPSPP
jgi:hypothetical protein